MDIEVVLSVTTLKVLSTERKFVSECGACLNKEVTEYSHNAQLKNPFTDLAIRKRCSKLLTLR